MQKQNDPKTGKIGISWTDWSSNPIRAKILESPIAPEGSDMRPAAKIKKGWACVKYGPDCENCYAERINLRWGTGLKYSKDQLENVGFYLDEREFKAWQKVSGQRIFVCDMTDLFGEFMSGTMIHETLYQMAECKQNTFQVLTKRAYFMCKVVRSQLVLGADYSNIWFGLSAGNQEVLERRFISEIATLPNLWLSLEPMIGRINLGSIAYIRSVKWIVAGGESQTGCRPLDLDWLYDLVAQCSDLGIPLFIKQLGGHPDKRKDINQWPDGLRVQEFPDGLKPKEV